MFQQIMLKQKQTTWTLMAPVLSMEMRLEEKGGLLLEMFVLCSQNLKKQIPDSSKQKVECSKLLVMLIKV